MIRDLILSLVSTFVVEPFQTQVSARLNALGAPPAIVRDVGQCVGAAPAALADRVTGDWGWAISTGVNLTIGRTTPEAVLAETVPACAPAVRAARTFLSSTGA